MFPNTSVPESVSRVNRVIEIDGNRVVLKIPKKSSNQMPRITNGEIKLTGTVKRYNNIEITKISRR
jgi:hypothetical protein